MATDPSDPRYLAFVARDIEDAGAVFAAQAENYNGLMAYDGTECPFGTPRGGNDQIDRMLETVLRLAGEVHVEISQAVGNHGMKLQAAADNYDTAEKATVAHVQSVGQLFAYVEQQPLPASAATPD
jgi:Family of unknown function (DUF6317)